jgi:hypothetical protein
LRLASGAGSDTLDVPEATSAKAVRAEMAEQNWSKNRPFCSAKAILLQFFQSHL